MWVVAIDVIDSKFELINLKIFNNIKITLHVKRAFLIGEKPLIFQDSFREENGIAVRF